MNAIHPASDEPFYFGLIDVRYLIPGDFPAFGGNGLDVGIITSTGDSS